MAIVTTSDFSGKYKVAQDQFNVVILQGYIDKYVNVYLAKLLGATLSDALIADIGGGSVPTDALFLAIFNPFTLDVNSRSCIYDLDLDNVVISAGIKEMLIGFIYWHYMSDQRVQANSISGTSTSSTEMSTVRGIPESQVYQRYNEAVTSARAIQYKCEVNANDYTDFNGVEFLYNWTL